MLSQVVMAYKALSSYPEDFGSRCIVDSNIRLKSRYLNLHRILLVLLQLRRSLPGLSIFELI